MHTNKNLNILLLSDSDFTNSIKELKEELSFKISFLPDKIENLSLNIFQALLIQRPFIEEKEKQLLSQIKKNNILKIFFFSGKQKKDYERQEDIKLPIHISDFNNKILELISKDKFHLNSMISIGNYILDKNEKKLSKNKSFTILTEKEIQLLELLSKKVKTYSKKEILNTVWKYASDADTHTVETHIYRLRKKIKKIFLDENFILNKNHGYQIEKNK